MFNNVAGLTAFNIKKNTITSLRSTKENMLTRFWRRPQYGFPTSLILFSILQIGSRPRFFTPRLYCKLTQFLCSLSFYIPIEISSPLTLSLPQYYNMFRLVFTLSLGFQRHLYKILWHILTKWHILTEPSEVHLEVRIRRGGMT